ncbi:DUF3828 domain-containing protein [Phenylobacterium sp.]|jgi:hypothetical protein|uniref:DUF3828 domain-containing protein n=1 Tax=Phenylobacterium sp. TaxID=1871053 RepID=UPI002F3EEFEF
MRLSAPILTALALLAAMPAASQDAASADAFVRGLYAAYGTGHSDNTVADYFDRGMARVFAPRLIALIRRDRALTPKGDVGAFDFDPICSCQDDAGLKMTDLKVTAPARGTAAARVALRFAGGETIRLTLDLVATSHGWRINDIHSADTPSLAAYLRQHGGGR